MEPQRRPSRPFSVNKSSRGRFRRCFAGAIFPGKCLSSPDTSSETSTEEETADPQPELRLLCSYGGQITGEDSPFPKYRGGENRIIAMDRHSSVAELFRHLSSSLLGGHSFTLKYHLSVQGFNTLVSVVTDEDLRHMIEVFDRISSFPMGPPPFHAGPPRLPPTKPRQPRYLRVFLVRGDPETASLSASPTAQDNDSSDWDFSDDEPPEQVHQTVPANGSLPSTSTAGGSSSSRPN